MDRRELGRFGKFLLAGGVAAAANYGSRFLFSVWLPFAAAVTLAFFVGLVTGSSSFRRFHIVSTSPSLFSNTLHRTTSPPLPAFRALHCKDELCPPEAFEDLTPDEQHFHEATGNEGASFERTYRRAGSVLWPRAWRLVVLNRAGLGAAAVSRRSGEALGDKRHRNQAGVVAGGRRTFRVHAALLAS